MEALHPPADAVLPLSGAAICGWLLLQLITGTIADIAASIFGFSIWAFCPVTGRLRNLTDVDLAPKLAHLPVWSSDWITPIGDHLDGLSDGGH